MNSPRVIIGLPVYNGERFIGAAIESHLTQSFDNFDLIISDNGSTDSTREICSDYASNDKRIRYLQSPENRGILWNHRRVLEEIQNPNQYFRWAGADDVMEPGLLQVMVDVLDSRPDVEAVVPDTKNIDEHGEIIGSAPRTLNLQSPDAFERARDVLLASYQHVIAYGLLRASTVRVMRTGPNYPGWDSVFVWELALRGKLVQPAEPALLRRFHAGSISRVRNVSEVRRWVEPNSVPGMNFPHWSWAYERARALIACPLSTRDRLRIGRFLARTTLWQRGAMVRDITQAARRTLGLSDEYTL
jgi:glycosyltransferase involved in cell wall biosynthesis